jgi:pectinesterase
VNALVPTVTTTTATGITQTTASTGGTVSSNGGAAVSSEGVYYGLTSPPGTLCASAGTSSPFTIVLGSTCTALTSNTPYFYQACATNSAGQGCGAILNFTTLAVPGPIRTSEHGVAVSGVTVH